MVSFKTIFKMKSLQQFFGSFYYTQTKPYECENFIKQKDIAWNKGNYMYAVVVVVVIVLTYVSLTLYANIKGTAKSLCYFPLKHS